MIFLSIELNESGFIFDTEWLYLAISWWVIGIAVASFITYKIFKRKDF